MITRAAGAGLEEIQADYWLHAASSRASADLSLYFAFWNLSHDKSILARGEDEWRGHVVGRLRSGLPKSAFSRLCSVVDLSKPALCGLLAVDAKLLDRQRCLRPAESDRVFRLGHIFQRALDVTGDPDAAREWLKTPNPALDDQTPLSMADTELGAKEVEDILGRIEHGVFG